MEMLQTDAPCVDATSQKKNKLGTSNPSGKFGYLSAAEQKIIKFTIFSEEVQ